MNYYKNLIKPLIFPFFLLFTAFNIFLASWTVLHNDIFLISDIARDMFLLDEIAQKHLVLIGPRSSVGGLFHGPLWSYLNFPGYLIGNGDPVAVGWYWIFLIAAFLFSSYFVVKKLFNRQSAMLFVLMSSLYLVFHANSLFNPYGAMFLLPAFFFFIIRYVQTLKLRFLIFHLFTLGGLIEFQLAIGLPFLILSGIFLIIFILKKHKLKHLLAFATIPLVLSNFIIFDARHQFLFVKNAMRHLGSGDSQSNLISLIIDRFKTIISGTEFLRFGPDNGQLYATIIFFIFLVLQIKNNVNRKIYLIFLYFYFGFFTLSLLNRYDLLSFYVFPLITLVFLIFSSFISSKYKIIFLFIFSLMYVFNLIGAYNYVKSLDQFIGKDQYSWKAIFTAAQSAYKGNEKEFGYFVYAPDIVGYGPRYAMEYAQKVYKKNAYAFEKKPITYLFIEPAARNNPFTSEEKWKLSQIHIISTPLFSKNFPGGYKMEKHSLTPNELALPFDPGINPGLHYR